ncbi:MAG: response regulator [Gammaproteobacteria bacterium]|nr:response regulator [Gammaproteobacteria bacterium]
MAHILIVDDDPAILALLSEALLLDGYKVITATNGHEAKELCHHDIGLIITDLVMPEQNGLDLIMDITRKYPNIPIIAISGGGGIKSNFFDYLSVAKLIGATHTFEKPFRICDLKYKIKEFSSLSTFTQI